MSRISEVTPVALVREAVAPRTEINWDPLSNTGLVRFEIADIVTVKDTGELVGLEPRADNNVVAIDITEIFGMTLTTPYGDVSGAQVAAYIKVLFDQLYTERFPAAPPEA